MAKRPEPENLRRGKEFHALVQDDWARTARDGEVTAEHGITLLGASTRSKRRRRGRLDIFVDDVGNFVSIVEIKSTDWDRVKPRNRQSLLSAHRRQVWRYIEKYLDGDKVEVCPGIIYPRAPVSPGLKNLVEGYLKDYGLQVVWYHV
jgi:hypothetical protein